MSRERQLSLIELEALIFQMGYSQETATLVIAFLKSNDNDLKTTEDLQQSLIKVQIIVDQILKPRYIAKSINHLLALINISLEYRDNTIYFVKHLFEPNQEDGLLYVEYALIQRIAIDSYNIAVIEADTARIIYQKLNLQQCLNALETDPALAP